jgi:hypothetical protein
MRGSVLALLFLLAVAPVGFSQDAAGEQFLKKLGFTDAEMDKIAAIQQQSQADIQKARAELAIAKAELARLLLNVDAGMKEIEKSVRAAMEWEVQVKLAEISRELKLRKLIGDRKWRRMIQELRQKQEALRGGGTREKTGGSDESKRQRARALLKELRELLGGEN